jgi:hypothetical protein
MTEPARFNMFASTQDAADAGRENRFRKAAADAFASAPDARGDAVQRAVAADTANSLALDKQLTANDENIASKAAGAAKYVLNALETGKPEAAEGAYQAVRPFLARIGAAQGKVPPPNWDPSMTPMLHQVIAAAQGGAAAGAVQSTYVDDTGQRVAIMRDGSQKVIGGNLNPGKTVNTEINGRPATVVFDPVTKTSRLMYVDGAGGPVPDQPAASAGPVAFTNPNGVPVQIDPSLPPEVQAQIRAGEGAPPVAPPVAAPVAPAGVAALGLTPAEKAAQEAEAKARIALQYDPRVAAATEGAKLDTQLSRSGAQAEADAAKTYATEEAKGRGQQAGDFVQNARKEKKSLDAFNADIQESTRLIDQLLADPKKLDLVTGMGRPVSYVPGTAAADAKAIVDRLKARAGFSSLQEMRNNSPTGGALGSVSEGENVMLQNSAAALQTSQSPEAFRQSLLAYRTALQNSKARANQAYADHYTAPPVGPQNTQSVVDQRPAPAAGGREIKRTGRLNGRTVIQYTDGTIEYGD